MIPTWLAHGTEYMQLRMNHEFSCFPLFCFCFVEENARMSKHENKWYAILQIKKFVERICMMMPWLMQNVRLEYDNGQMQDMSIMMLWRDAYVVHDMNAFYGHESPENYLFLLAHLGAQCPMCTIKKVIWTFRLPVTKDETNIQCMLGIKCGSDLIRTDFWSKNVG